MLPLAEERIARLNYNRVRKKRTDYKGAVSSRPLKSDDACSLRFY